MSKGTYSGLQCALRKEKARENTVTMQLTNNFSRHCPFAQREVTASEHLVVKSCGRSSWLGVLMSVYSDVEHFTQHSRLQYYNVSTTKVWNCLVPDKDLRGQNVVLVQSTVLPEMLDITIDIVVKMHFINVNHIERDPFTVVSDLSKRSWCSDCCTSFPPCRGENSFFLLLPKAWLGLENLSSHVWRRTSVSLCPSQWVCDLILYISYTEICVYVRMYIRMVTYI